MNKRLSINSIFAKGLAAAILAGLLDQISKFYMLKHFEIGESMRILPFFSVVLVKNTGISFGMFHGLSYAQALFSGVAVLITISLLIWLYKSTQILQALALGLAIGGAIGNIIDRVRFGSVTDFLDFHLNGYHWPAFNIADSAVCIGAFILLFQSLFDNKKETVS